MARSKEHREGKEVKEREAKRIALLTCSDFMEQLRVAGSVFFATMKVAELIMMIRYQFKSNEYKEKGIKKVELKSIAERLYKEHLEKEDA